MSKDLKLSFVLLTVFTGIIMAWKTLINFFNGAGINFVAILALAIVLLLIILKNKETRSRIMDMFIISCVFVLLEIIVYIPVEFGISKYSIYRGFMVYQNVITFLALMFFTYIGFRFILEYLNKKLTFIEFVLGNRTKKAQRVQKLKELENGTLEEKPNKVQEPQIVEKVEIETIDEIEE